MAFRTRTLEGLLKGGGYIFAVWVNGGKHTIECLRLGDSKFTKVILGYWEALRPSIEIWTYGQLLFENTEQWITWLGNCASKYELQKIWAWTVWKHIMDCLVSEMHTWLIALWPLVKFWKGHQNLKSLGTLLQYKTD